MGKDSRADLYPVDFKDGNIGIYGRIASPRVTRSTFKGVYTYVNGRMVRDRIIRHALMEGYAQRLMKGCFPVAVLFITVPFDQVDVNVHPTKNEVRFVRQKEVHDRVKRAVFEILRKIDRPPWGPRESQDSNGIQEQPQIAEESVDYRSTGKERFAPMSIEYPASSIQHPASRIQPSKPPSGKKNILPIYELSANCTTLTFCVNPKRRFF